MWQKVRAVKRLIIHISSCIKGIAGKLDIETGEYSILDVISEKGHHMFFGYYDLQQLNSNGQKLLLHRVRTNAVTSTTPVDICVYDLKNKNYDIIAQSRAWSWQQGSRLRWNPHNEDEIIFNNLQGNHYVCEFWNIKTKHKSKVVPIALYDIDSNVRFGYGVNYSRLQRLRPGYGYDSLPDMSEGQMIPKDDGIFRYDFEKDKVELIISYERLCADFPEGKYEHYINHISVSPCGDKFMFFHLWSLGDVNKWKLRLYVSDVNGKELRLLEEQDVISHYTWKDNDILLTTKINKASKATCYYEYNTNSGKKEAIQGDNLYLDGHPTYFGGGKSFISDTYPLPNHLQNMFVFDKSRHRYLPIASVYHDPRLYGEKRCDLHPRLSKSNDFVTFDTTFKGNRKSVVVLRRK